ncbi:hypothetical protein RJ640_024429 [Escallonia rubra]|uniref:F-box domain-containing protein n=1 Tax=Escallonia rubra TaxID=112253 RepID=A0AA88RF80_9ASTE|nr:hypothetical protein RJ640_024429 [Escallonia rubra]
MPTGKNGRGKRSRRHHHSRPKPNKPQAPKSTCNLPHDVIVNILSRLPVKTLLRFRSVSKPWRSLIRSPKFITTHLQTTVQNPSAAATSLILHSLHHKSEDHLLFLVSITPFRQELTKLDHPFPGVFLEMEVVGSINGLVCLCRPRWGDGITIWNPATKQSKGVKLSGYAPNPVFNDRVSIGFCYDPVGDDYKVISILNFKPETKVPARVEVYSCGAESWKKLDVKPPFTFLQTKCIAILKGVPYWVVGIDDEFGSRKAFVWFDVQKGVFHMLPAPMFGGMGVFEGCLVEWRDNLAVIVYPKTGPLYVPLDVWVMEDDGDGIGYWVKKFTVGPVLGIVGIVGFSRKGEIVGKDAEGKVVLYDWGTGGVEYLCIDDAQQHFGVCNYNESLVSIKGFSSVSKQMDPDRQELINSCYGGLSSVWTMLSVYLSCVPRVCDNVIDLLCGCSFGLTMKVVHSADGGVSIVWRTEEGDIDSICEVDL